MVVYPFDTGRPITKSANSRNFCNSFTVIGSGQSVTAFTLSPSIATPLGSIWYPRYDTSGIWNTFQHLHIICVRAGDMMDVFSEGFGMNQDVV